jgi:hypothetical protein
MLKAAHILSISALLMSALAFSIARWSFPRVGYEGTIVLAGLLFWASALCVAVTWGICLVLFANQRRSRLVWPFGCSVVSAAILVISVVLM